MKLLQLAYKMPWPHKDGGALALYRNTLCMLHAGIEVKMLAINTPKDHVDLSLVPEDLKKSTGLECVTIDTRLKPLGAFLNIFNHRSYFLSRFYDGIFEKRLTDILRTNTYHVVVLEHLSLAQYLPAIRKHSGAKVIMRPQNIEHRLWKSYTRNNRNFLAKAYLTWNTYKLKKYELKMPSRLDGIMALTEEDAIFFKELAPGIPVTCIPFSVDFRQVSNTTCKGQTSFYYLGSMDWLPNRQGVDWLIAHVLPLLQQNTADLSFHLAGKKMPEAYQALSNPNLIVDGEIEDAISYQSDKEVLVVPLLSGGGVRIKIIEAMAMGKTVIASTIAAKGIPCIHEHDILIADTAGDFARQMKRCHEDPGLVARIGQQARITAESCYSMGTVAEKMMAFYREVS